jgi:hypothetical protein
MFNLNLAKKETEDVKNGVKNVFAYYSDTFNYDQTLQSLIIYVFSYPKRGQVSKNYISLGFKWQLKD